MVTIDSFLEPPVGLQGESARSKVTTTFALAIEAYPIKIFYDGVPLRPGTFSCTVPTMTWSFRPPMGRRP